MTAVATSGFDATKNRIRRRCCVTTTTTDRERMLLAELRANRTSSMIDRGADVRSRAGGPPAGAGQGCSRTPPMGVVPVAANTGVRAGPQSFRRLRLDRNRNKITSAEQDRFGRLTIGIVGLSVGHSIAHTLALEGLCGRLRLADNDRIELSNLNRIPATVLGHRDQQGDGGGPTDRRTRPVSADGCLHLGRHRAESMDEFFDGLDLVIEECDRWT